MAPPIGRGSTNRKQGLAAALWELADLDQASSTGRSFRARAYRRAVWSLDHLSPELGEPTDEILAVPGIGAGISALVEEYRASSSLRGLERLRDELPARAGHLAALPRMTPRRLRMLKELSVDGPDDLLAAIEAGEVERIPGVGAGTAGTWRRLLVRQEGASIPIQRAVAAGNALARHLERHVTGLEATITGALRRLEETVEAVEVLAIGGNGLRAFVEQSAIVRSCRPEDHVLRLDTLAAPAVVFPTSPDTAGSALVASTGPPGHLEALERLAGGPLSGREAATEDDVYILVGQPVPPPPARGSDFPPPADLVDVGDLRGDLHLHSDWSRDGRQTLEEIVSAARRRGLEYVAVTDHAADLGFGGLTAADLERQRDSIELLRAENPDLLILHGVELNIARDGSVDYDDEVLVRLDFRLAAVHSHFALPAVEQTERVLRAIAHPLIDAVAHLTGRRIGVRPPIDIDVAAVVEAAAGNRTALEVNGHLDRLDLSARHARLAVAAAAPLIADSDAHRVTEMDNQRNAIGVLQQARAPTRLVVNTWTSDELKAWLRR